MNALGFAIALQSIQGYMISLLEFPSQVSLRRGVNTHPSLSAYFLLSPRKAKCGHPACEVLRERLHAECALLLCSICWSLFEVLVWLFEGLVWPMW